MDLEGEFTHRIKKPKVEEINSVPLNMGFMFVDSNKEKEAAKEDKQEAPQEVPETQEVTQDVMQELPQGIPQNQTKDIVPKQNPRTKKPLPKLNTILIYIAIAIAVILVIVLVVFIVRKIYISQIDNLSETLGASSKKEAQLQEQLKRTNTEAQEYAQQIQELQDEIDELKTQQENEYFDPRDVPTQVRPMTKKSYDEPAHGDDVKSGSQKVLDERQRTMELVNKYRPTVEDDERQTMAEVEERRTRQDNKAARDIQSVTHHNQFSAVNNKPKVEVVEEKSLTPEDPRNVIHGTEQTIEQEPPKSNLTEGLDPEMLNKISGVLDA